MTSNQKRLPKNRSYCFTSYHVDKPVFEKSMRFLMFAPEYTKTGRFHWQGYVVYKSQRTIPAIVNAKRRKGLPPYGKLIIADGSYDNNRSYIFGPYEKDGKKKPVNPAAEAHGDPPRQGKRTDLDNIKDDIVSGVMSVADIVLEDPKVYHQYGRTLMKIEDLTLRKRTRKWMTKGIWYYGPTGCGKSHKALHDFDESTHYIWKDDNGWQDGYVGQPIVIINDFRGDIPYAELLQMIDKWPHYVRRRGREPAPFLAREVIITSPMHPTKAYESSRSDSIKQLLRRLMVVPLKGKPLEVLSDIKKLRH